jgi:hypothetical protein
MSSRLRKKSESRQDLKGFNRADNPLLLVNPSRSQEGDRGPQRARPSPTGVGLRGHDELGIYFSLLFSARSELPVNRGARALAREMQPSPRTALLQGGPCVLL